MRRLLLLLLTFLLPLQLLAAPVGELAPLPSCPQVVTTAAPTESLAGLVALDVLDAQTSVAALGLDDDQPDTPDTPDTPTKQLDGEDHAMPMVAMTPDLPWHPFPHAFAAPSDGASLVRDLQHRPPLA